MATLDCHQRRSRGVTLVELHVHSDIGETVRVESNLRPVWPPRRGGRPASGWDETGYDGVVAEDGSLVLGYATPAEPADQPAVLAEEQPLSGDDCEATGAETTGPATAEIGETTRAARLVQVLGGSEPPRCAVPTPAIGDGRAVGGIDRDGAGGDWSDESGENGSVSDRAASGDVSDRSVSAVRDTGPPDSRGAPLDESVPESREVTGRTIEEWVADVERRLDVAQRLCEPDSAGQVRSEIESLGGIDEVRTLAARLSRDRALLDDLAPRCVDLEDRLARTELPLSTLERVA